MKFMKNGLTKKIKKVQDLRLFEIPISTLTSKTLVQFILAMIFISLNQNLFAQSTDNKSVTSNFGGAVTVTNNGISFIPTFSLGKPRMSRQSIATLPGSCHPINY